MPSDDPRLQPFREAAHRLLHLGQLGAGELGEGPVGQRPRAPSKTGPRLAIDLASGIGKTFFFGFAIGLIGCFNGLRTSGGADGVGRATTATVVTASITVLIMDFFLTKLFLPTF